VTSGKKKRDAADAALFTVLFVRKSYVPFFLPITDLGRLPHPEEFAQTAELVARLGSSGPSPWSAVLPVADWQALRQRRTEDLLVYLALARFKKGPPLMQLPLPLRYDMRAFFGTYASACRQADALLFRAGDPAAIDAACARSPVGKLLPDDLYVHITALPALEPLLRVYEGCGRAFLGEVEGPT
jgi:DNA phosphorothioation-associated putative methyltransferase